MTEFPTYKIERAYNEPLAIGAGPTAGLSQAFYIEPAVALDSQVIAILSVKNNVQLYQMQVAPEEEGKSLFIASVLGQSLQSWARLESAIKHLGIVLNAGNDPRFAETLRPF
jgi:hypothetical protein